MQIGNAKRFEKLFVEGCINCMLFSHVYLAVGRHSEHKIPKCFLSQRWWFHVRIGASCSTGFRGSLRCHCNQGRGLKGKNKQGTAWKLLLSLQDVGSLPACNVALVAKCGSFLQIQMFLGPTWSTAPKDCLIIGLAIELVSKVSVLPVASAGRVEPVPIGEDTLTAADLNNGINFLYSPIIYFYVLTVWEYPPQSSSRPDPQMISTMEF